MYDRPNFCLPLEIERKLKLLYIIAPKELIILHDAQVESTPKPQNPKTPKPQNPKTPKPISLYYNCSA